MSNALPALKTSYPYVPVTPNAPRQRIERPVVVEENLGFEEMSNRFISYMKVRNYSERTLVKYRAELKHLFTFLRGSRGLEYLDDVTKKDILEYENSVYSTTRIKDGKPLSQESKVGRIVVLKSFYKFLSKTELLPYNPAANIDIPVVRNSRLREVLSEEEMFKLLDSVKGANPIEVRNRAMLEFLYSTAVRAEELLNINIRDLDIEKEEVRIRYGKGRMGKRERLLPVGKVALEWLKTYIENIRPALQKSNDEGYLFLSRNGRKLLIIDPNRIVKFYAKRCGITKKIVCHSMRHSCATHMLKRGCDIRFIQDLLGHDSIETTVIYTRLVIDDLKEIHDKTHPREQVSK